MRDGTNACCNQGDAYSEDRTHNWDYPFHRDHFRTKSASRLTTRRFRATEIQKLCGAPACRSVAFRIDTGKLLSALKTAPREASGLQNAPVIGLPMPDGSNASVAVFESSSLSPEMAKRYPELKTYRGRRVDDPSSIVALDYTPAGLHVMLLSGTETTMIDPTEDGVYLSYNPAGSPGVQECALDSGRLRSAMKTGTKAAPNGGESLTAGSQTSVTWDVAKTDQAPISTSQVRILLSTDGGLSYSVVLAEAVPNNGSATLTIPAGISTTQGRIQVGAAWSIYFDVSDANFTIR